MTHPSARPIPSKLQHRAPTAHYVLYSSTSDDPGAKQSKKNSVLSASSERRLSSVSIVDSVIGEV